MATKKTRTLKLEIQSLSVAFESFSYGRCFILTDQPSTCPLCKAYVAPGEVHECERKEVKP